MTPLPKLLRLNARVACLALGGRWLTPERVGSSYDRIGPTYDGAWQYRLRPVTDEVLARLPVGLEGQIIDLGCGTGYATSRLARDNPAAKVVGVDISAGMLDVARQRVPPNASLVQDEMLHFLQERGEASAAMVVSFWALGYSHPSRLLRQVSRVLDAGDVFAFVVNYRDTLAPVFRAFRRCMFEFPDRVRLAAWPRFPARWDALQASLAGAGFQVRDHRDGQQPIVFERGPLLPQIRQTGILAGFDAMLDLSGPVAARFETELAPGRDSICHHYAAVVAEKV